MPAYYDIEYGTWVPDEPDETSRYLADVEAAESAEEKAATQRNDADLWRAAARAWEDVETRRQSETRLCLKRALACERRADGLDALH